MNKTLFEVKLQVAKEVNTVLLNSESGQPTSAKAVGMSIQNILDVLEEVARELSPLYILTGVLNINTWTQLSRIISSSTNEATPSNRNTFVDCSNK